MTPTPHPTPTSPYPNRWGTAAWAHMIRYLPERLASIPDPASYFCELGDQADTEVELLASALTTPAAVGESFATVLGRARMSRLMAEEQILAELIYPTPTTDPQDCARDATGAYLGHDPQMSPTWTPLWEGGNPEE